MLAIPSLTGSTNKGKFVSDSQCDLTEFAVRIYLCARQRRMGTLARRISICFQPHPTTKLAMPIGPEFAMNNELFNLDAPPNFRGIHPDIPITFYRRHLPHWRQNGATYFVTFRLVDSLPQSKLQFLKRLREEWERRYPPPRNEATWQLYAEQFTNTAERWLDESYGACHFRARHWFDDLRDRLHHFQDQRYFLSCWVIMPKHCHAAIRPYDGYALEDLLGAMKGVTSRHINLALATSGPLWEQESYDRIVRDEVHLWRVIQYIGRNPRLAGLGSEAKWRRWIHPDWDSVGWRFIDA